MRFQPILIERPRESPACWTRNGRGGCQALPNWRCENCIHYQVKQTAEKWVNRWVKSDE